MILLEPNNTSPKMDSCVQVLDKGYVQLLDTFGDDLTVVNAARVSFNKEATEITHKDEKLIKYLAEHNHVTPFFHPQVRMRIKMPIFVAREWFRHQIGFARNEVSRRYVDYEPEMYSPTLVRARDVKLKQGSKAEAVNENPMAVAMIQDINDRALETYTDLLAMGTAPEVARTVLPQGMYTEFIETGSLAAYARLCGLRLDPAAQLEIRLYADAVRSLLMDKFPVSWRALMRESGEETAASEVKAPHASHASHAPQVKCPEEQLEWVKKLISHINDC
jgi:thymidylate synthase (FAD)